MIYSLLGTEVAMFHNSEEENESCLEEMIKFSSFCLETEIQAITDKKFEERLNKLLKDIEYGYDTTEETICFNNFVSYLYWRCDKKKKAMEFAIKALDLGSQCTYTSLGGTDNLVTVCNLCFFHRGNGDVAESRQFSGQFKKMSKRDDFQELKYIAKAELAVCLSKLGPFCSTKAIQMFRESVDKISTTADCWQFYFAMTLRRKTHYLAIQNKNDAQCVDDDREALDKFIEIIDHTSWKNLKSRSLCEVGVILYNRSKQNIATHGEIQEKYSHQNYMEWFEKALEVSPCSYYILQRYGQHLRYQKNLQKSKEILEKSLSVRETPFAHHHLGLTFQKMVLKEYSEQKKTRRLRRKNMSKYESAKMRNSYVKKKYSVETTSLKTSRDPEQVRAKIKSPRYTPGYPKDERLLSAEQHLQKALQIDESFDKARYDLGLVQRMLRRNDEALENFRFITSSYKGKSSNQILLICAYEQQAFCRLHLFETSKNENDVINAVDALNRGLDIFSLYVEFLPELKSVTSCIVEIEKIMEKYEILHLEKENRKENFAPLFEKAHEYIKAYDLYSKCEPKTAAVYQKMVKNLKAVGDYENAIGILNRLIIEKDPNTPPRLFLFQMFMDGASHSLENRNFEETKIRLLQCQKCIPTWEPHFDNCNDEENMLDFHILHTCEERCPLAEKLQQILTESFIKWNVTKNADDCMPGHTILKYYEDTIKRAKFILLFHHEKALNCDDDYLKVALGDLSSGTKKNVLSVILGDAGEQPMRYPTIVLPNDFATAGEDGKEDLEMLALKGRITQDILMEIFQLQANSDDDTRAVTTMTQCQMDKVNVTGNPS